jgi:glycosyltransferase involved in cell wall biosynthesis
MKILSLGNYFPPRYVGGAEVAACFTAYGLRQRGHDVRVLTVCALYPKPFNNRFEYLGLPVHEVGLTPIGLQTARVFDPRIYRQVIDEIRTVRPDLIHVHNVSGTSLAPHIAARQLGVPLVQTLHDHWLLCPSNTLYRADGKLCNSTSRWRSCGRCLHRYDRWGEVPLRRALFRVLTSDVRRFITPSWRLAELHAAAGYDLDRFRLLKYGLALDLFLGAGAVPPVRLPDANRENVALFSGAVVETKGLDVLIQALPLLVRYVEDFQLWVAGAGEDRYIAQLEAVGRGAVRVLGKLPFGALGQVYARSGLTLVPSVWYDNSPVVIYESLAAGTPVLGSAIGGIPELVQDGTTGYLVPPGDAVALAERAILHFGRPAAERQALRADCQAYARSELSMERHLDGLLAIYAEVLG